MSTVLTTIQKMTMKLKGTFEPKVVADLTRRGVPFEYEPEKIPYTTEHQYTPDIKIGKIFIELKGYFRRDAQQKMKRVKEQHPDKDIRLVFQKASATVEGAKKRKDGTKMTCKEWAERYGFVWSENTIPKEWIIQR